MDLEALLRQRESEWLDFKKEFHDNNASLLHDVLCLANSYTESDRYLVFGVSDARAVVGVANDLNRKTNANLQDFLRQANLNRIPTCVLETHDVGGLAVDTDVIASIGDDVRGREVRRSLMRAISLVQSLQDELVCLQLVKTVLEQQPAREGEN